MIKIYGTETCTYCAKAKNTLDNASINYHYYNIGVDVSKSEVLDILPEGWKTVPAIFIDNKFIGGYDDMIKYFEETSGGHADDI